MYKPLGPYSLFRKASSFYFISGIIPINEKGVLETDPKQAFKQVMENLKDVLNQAGLKLENLVKVTVFLADPTQVRVFNEIYSSYFKENPPARSMVFVNSLPLGSIIEIEAIAYSEEKK